MGDVDGLREARFSPRVREWAPCRRGLRAAISLVVILAVTGSAAVARAAADPKETCRRRQLAAGDRLYRTSHACWAKAFGKASFDLAGCLSSVESRFSATYAAAAASALKSGSQCSLRMPDGALLSIAVGDVDPLVFAIAGNVDYGNPTDLKLRSKVIGATAGFAKRAFDAELAFAKDGDGTRRDARFAGALAKLGKALAGTQASGLKHGIAYDGPDAATLADSLEASAGLWERLTRASQGSFALSGTVFAAEASFVDSDVNDTNTTPVFNGSSFAAQLLSVPSTVGGYVNLPGAGPNGNSFQSGDSLDRYEAFLRAGQVVLLVLGDDPSLVDLDLRISGGSLSMPLRSEGVGSIEMLTIPADGDYFIDVYPFSGCNCGSTYTLSVGQTVPAEARRAERTDVEFVPGELIVKLRDPSAQPEAAGASAARVAKPHLPPGLGLVQVAGDTSREMLVRLPVGAARAAMFQALGVASAPQMMSALGVASDEEAREETILALKTLRARPEIESVELNTILRASLVPDDLYYHLQWDFPLIRLPQAWDIETGDPNVVVAVVDTGVLLNHPDLQGKLVAGYDFISDGGRARDGDGIDPDPNDPGDRGTGAGASSFHGTHVAGTIAAATNNGIGVAGIAWGSKVMPVRVLGVNGGTLYDVLQGVRYAAGLANDSGTVPPKPADIINLSLGGGGFSQSGQDVFTQVHDAGVIVVAAAGNDATSAPSYPAAYDGVVSVAAVDLNGSPATYSNFGPTIDVTAPGGDTSVDRNADGFADGILSTLADDSVSPLKFGYAFYQGTSMATPHVAGVFALMRSVDPTLSPDQIDALLAAGKLTQDLRTPGRDDLTGWGLIDARASVIAAGAPDTGPAAPLSVTPSGLNLGLALDSLDFTVSNAGSDPITVTSVAVTFSDPNSPVWLTVAPLDADPVTGLGSYRATAVDRVTLANGSYSATIDIASSAGAAHIPVVMRVGGPTTSDTGFQYVLIVDAQSLIPIEEFPVAATNGSYAYAFSDIPQGDYLIISGSDLDDDLTICDGGEACGSYPTLDLPAPLTLDHDTTGIDFGVAFRQSIRTGTSIATPIPAAGLRRRAR
ncbi:MAG: S8 family peptidase [Myxococcota bacterium]